MRPKTLTPSLDNLQEAVRRSTSANRTFFIAFIALLIYLLIIIASTTDYQLLIPNSKTHLPFVDTDVSLFVFYIFAPLLVLASHFNLLQNLESHHFKLKNWESKFRGNKVPRAIIEPYLYDFSVLENDGILTSILRFFSNFLILYLSLATLLAFLWRFSDYQSVWITTWQFVIFIIDFIFSSLFLMAVEKRLQIFGLKFVLLSIAILQLSFVVYITNFDSTKLWQKEINAEPITDKTKSNYKNILYVGYANMNDQILNLMLPRISIDPYISLTLDDKPLRIEMSYEENENFEEWFNEKGKGLDLRDRSLKGAILNEADLRKAWLQHAKLNGAQLLNAKMSGANLTSADLIGAKLNRTILNGSNLTNVNLSSASLDGVQFLGANLTSAKMDNINAFGINLQESNLKGASFNGAKLYQPNFKNSSLISVNFENANLSYPDFQSSVIEFCNFKKATLSDSKFISARLGNSDFEQASLVGSDFRSSYINFGNFNGANLSKTQFQFVKFEDTTFYGANLEDANLQGANLFRAEMQGANLTFAKFDGASLKNANLQGANLKYSKFRGADLSDALLQGADISYAAFQGSVISNTHLHGVVINEFLYKNSIQKRASQGVQISTPDFKTIPDWLALNRLSKNSEYEKRIFLSKKTSIGFKVPEIPIFYQDKMSFNKELQTICNEGVYALWGSFWNINQLLIYDYSNVISPSMKNPSLMAWKNLKKIKECLPSVNYLTNWMNQDKTPKNLFRDGVMSKP